MATIDPDQQKTDEVQDKEQEEAEEDREQVVPPDLEDDDAA